MRDRSSRRWRGEVMAVAAAEGVTPMSFNGYDPAAFGANGTAAAIDASFNAMVAFNRRSAKTHSGVWRDNRHSPPEDRMRGSVYPSCKSGPSAGFSHSLLGTSHRSHAGSRDRCSPAQAVDNLDLLAHSTAAQYAC